MNVPTHAIDYTGIERVSPDGEEIRIAPEDVLIKSLEKKWRKKIMKCFRISIIIVLLFPLFSIGQVKNDTLPYYKKVEYDVPKIHQSIRYYFPKVIDSLIGKVIESEKNKFYFIEYVDGNEFNKIFLFACNWDIDTSNLSKLELLIFSTNRYYICKDLIIPVVFSSDFTCTFASEMGFTGATMYVKFQGRYPLRGKIIEYEWPSP